MAPREQIVEPINVLEEDTDEDYLKSKISKGPFLTDVVWPNAISIITFLLTAIYMIFTFPWIQHYKTSLFGFVYIYFATFGVTMGAHRFFTHTTFKAKLPLKLFIFLLFSMAGQYPLNSWVLDHRMHHKFSDKMGDPHNAKRGFFFSHVGWLMMKRDPVFKKKENLVDMSDIKNDPHIQIFDKYFAYHAFAFAFLIPTLVPCYFWDESFNIALKMTVIRYFCGLNMTWSVNSCAHHFGKRPYNAKCYPKENFMVSLFTNGEGYHNYHHTFPWDYKACETGKYNPTAFFIKTMSRLGLAYDLKETDPEYMKKIITGSGDQSHEWCKGDGEGMHEEISYETAGLRKPRQ